MTLDPLQIIAPVIGLPCWNVRRGISTFLMLEFGEPYLVIDEPQPDHPKIHVLSMFKYRQITLRGEYHIRIEEVQWQILQDGMLLAHQRSHADEAIRFLDGQILTGVTLDPERGSSVFTFDLGGTLTTTRIEPDDELWTLYDDHTDYTLTYRGDGKYVYNPGDTPPNEQVWLPCPRST